MTHMTMKSVILDAIGASSSWRRRSLNIREPSGIMKTRRTILLVHLGLLRLMSRVITAKLLALPTWMKR
jgi:hypothetical protein